MKPRVDYSDGVIRIFHDDLSGQHYEIPEDRINTSFKLLGWISHLSMKRWMTTDLIDQLITACEAYIDVNVDRNM